MDDQINQLPPQPTSSATQVSEQTPTTPVIDSGASTTAPTPTTSEEDKIIQIGKYKVQVIRHLCIGAATCVAVSPTTFQLDNENKAVIQEGSSDLAENILMAAQSCPTKAIVVTDTETGQQVWPN